MLAVAHDRRIRVAAFNHISPYFADVVWEGLSTAHVRAGLESSIDLERLRALWLPISPQPFISRMKDKRVLLVYARYDLSFPVRLSRQLVDEFPATSHTSPGVHPTVRALQHGDRTIQLARRVRTHHVSQEKSLKSSRQEP